MLEEIVPLEPLHFFDIEVDVRKSDTLLPDFLETGMAKVHVKWSQAGLHFTFEINRIFNEPHYPAGDCVELFIDTRCVKSATITRFCHHFFALPVAVDGEMAGEVTRFRTEERHPLAPGELIEVKSAKVGGKREMKIFVPKEALHGYDPSQFNKLGFTYRVLGADGKAQIFSASGEDVPFEHHPLLWATLRLENAEN